MRRERRAVASDTASEAAGQSGEDGDQTGSRQGLAEPIALPALTDRQYRFLIHTVGAGLGALRRDGLTVSDEREQAIRWLLNLVRQNAGHQTVTKVDSGSADGRVSACTTAEAGQRLGLTRWAVRKAIARGALTARQATARGPYVIDEQSIAAFERRKRAARAA